MSVYKWYHSSARSHQYHINLILKWSVLLTSGHVFPPAACAEVHDLHHSQVQSHCFLQLPGEAFHTHDILQRKIPLGEKEAVFIKGFSSFSLILKNIQRIIIQTQTFLTSNKAWIQIRFSDRTVAKYVMWLSKRDNILFIRQPMHLK